MTKARRGLWLVAALTLVVILALPVGIEADSRFTSPVSPVSEPTPTVVIEPTPTVVVEPTPTMVVPPDGGKPTAVVLSSFTCR